VPSLTATRRPPVALIFAITATAIMGNSLIAPVIPDILRDLQLSDGSAGLIISAVALPGVIVAPIIGLLADRFGRRQVLVPCLTLFGIGGMAVAFAPNLTVILAARLLQGVGAAGLINLAVVLIGDHWDGSDRTRLIGRNASMLTVGLATFPLLSGSIAEIFSWRISLLPQGAALVVAALVWRNLDATRPSAPATLSQQLSGLGVAFRQPAIRAVIIGGFVVFVLVFGMFLSTLPLHLERQFGMSSGTRGLFLSIPAITGSLVAFNLQRIVGRFNAHRTLIGSGVLFVISFFILGVAPVAGFVVLGCALYGLGDGALIPILQNRAVDEAPPAQRGAVVAVWVGAARLGQTVGPVAAASLFIATSTGTAMVIGSGIAVAMVIYLAMSPLGSQSKPVSVGT
jgi:MFS transporter, ACDE family, multidrug resistance protein